MLKIKEITNIDSSEMITEVSDLDELSNCILKFPKFIEKIRQGLIYRNRTRIHPAASISPSAIIGEDVYIRRDVKIYDYASVRGGSVLLPEVVWPAPRKRDALKI